MTKASGKKHRVGLIDDHTLVRHGFARLIDAQDDFEMAFEAATSREAVEALSASVVDLVVTDLALREGSGIDLVRELSERWPKVPVLVLSMHEEGLYAERVLRAGARGYVMKHEPPEVLLAAMRQVVGGGVHLSAEMSAKLLHRFVASRGESAAANAASPLDPLSDRELEVFQLIGQGLPNRVIAERLYVSIKTVESHRERIKQKLGLAGGAELLRYAIEHGLNSDRPR